jgi:hypothetical protein
MTLLRTVETVKSTRLRLSSADAEGGFSVFTTTCSSKNRILPSMCNHNAAVSCS